MSHVGSILMSAFDAQEPNNCFFEWVNYVYPEGVEACIKILVEKLKSVEAKLGSLKGELISLASKWT